MKLDKHIIRVLVKYPKKEDFPSNEFELEGVELQELQTLFKEPSNEPMYDCYPVSKVQAESLQKYVDEKIDVESYDYFLECHAVPAAETGQPSFQKYHSSNSAERSS